MENRSPTISRPEWFLRNVVDRKVMEELGKRVSSFYDELFTEIVYRAHHNSFKVSFADIFYNDFVNYIVRSCGLRRNFWRYLPEHSTLKYMYMRRKRFLSYLRRKDRKKRMTGGIRWSLDFWLSQLSFWYATVRSFHEIWRKVVFENYAIPNVVSWKEGIVLYIISDFLSCFKEHGEKCVRKGFLKKYGEYAKIESR